MAYVIGPTSTVNLHGTAITAHVTKVDIPMARQRIVESMTGVPAIRYDVGKQQSEVRITLNHNETTEDLVNKIAWLDSFVFHFVPDTNSRMRYTMQARVDSIVPADAGIGGRALIMITLVPKEGILHRGLTGLYDFQEGTGQVLTDYSGHAFDGELGTTSGSDAADPTWATTPSRLSFTTNDIVVVTDNAVHSSPEVSVMAAVQLDATNDPGAHAFLEKNASWSLRQFGTTYDWNVTLGNTGAAVADTGWHIITGVAEVTGADVLYSIYIDGALGSSAQTTGSLTLNSNDVGIGANTTLVNFLEGDIVRAAMWNRPLQALEVADYYYDWREKLAVLGLTLP